MHLGALLAFSMGPLGARAQDLTEERRIEIAARLSESAVSVQVGASGGSGFVVGPERWIITNAHVVTGYRYKKVVVKFGDGSELPGRVLANDPRHDLAVVEAHGDVPARPLELGSADSVRVGQTVLAFGSPFGLDGTLTQGIVSARRDLPGIGGGDVRGLIQTDAPINPGNSGGPLVNALGHVIGVNTAILSRTGGSHGIGFAVPVSYVEALLKEVRRELHERRRLAEANQLPAESQPAAPPRQRASARPQVTTPVWLGIYGDDFRGGGFRGVRVQSVVARGPAAQAGLLGASDAAPRFVRQLGIAWTGHIILAVDGHPIRNMQELQRALSARRPGDKVTVTVTVGPGVVSGETVVRLQRPPSPASTPSDRPAPPPLTP